MRFLRFVLLIPFCLFSQIPATFHYFHLDQSPISEDDHYSLRCLMECHPKAKVKIWTGFNDPKIPGECQICSPEPGLSEEELRREVLFKEGGIWIHPDLIVCKPLDLLLTSNEFFQYPGALIGSIPGKPLPLTPIKSVFPEDLILPSQVFTAASPLSPLSGACFWKFSNYPLLSRLLRKVIKPSDPTVEQKQIKRIFSIRNIFLGSLAFCFLNGFFFCFFSRRAQLFINLVLFLRSMKYPILVICGIFSAYLAIGFFTIKPISFTDFYQLCGLGNSMKALDRQDLKVLEAFKTNYDRLSKAASQEAVLIPHTIHFIWLGNKDFPATSVQNIQSWKTFHPDWKFKFWTDKEERPVPIEGMEKCLIQELECAQLESYIPRAKNWGEASDLLRYEILYKEGGVYIDHDVECYSSFEPFHFASQFYAAMEPFHNNVLKGGYITVTNCLIGSAPGHPILSDTMEGVIKKWEECERMFPHLDKSSTMLRTLGRTFHPFGYAVENRALAGEPVLVFPSALIFPDEFEGIADRCALANHKWDNSWLKDHPVFTENGIPDQLLHELFSLYKDCFHILRCNLYTLIGLLIILGLLKIPYRTADRIEKGFLK